MTRNFDYEQKIRDEERFQTKLVFNGEVSYQNYPEKSFKEDCDNFQADVIKARKGGLLQIIQAIDRSKEEVIEIL